MYHFNSISEQIQMQLKSGNKLIRLIALNVIVFILIKIISVFAFLFQHTSIISEIADTLSLPASIFQLSVQPWAIITYMFLHVSFWHILFNMLVLYWFGNLFINYFSQRRLIHVYLIGGICGGLLYILSYNTFPIFNKSVINATAMGASASVYAIMIAIATYQPNTPIRLFLFGTFKLKYFAVFLLILDFIQIPMNNAGGHIAHIGGALFGFIYTLLFVKGLDLSSVKFLNFKFRFPSKKPKMSVHVNNTKKTTTDHEYNILKKEKQKKIDVILEKISDKGYESLSKEEKELLFKAGKE